MYDLVHSKYFTMDKSIAAVNTAVHRSKLTIAAVNQNSTVTWLALRRRGRGRGNIITYSVIAAGVSMRYLPPRKSFFNGKCGGIYRRNSTVPLQYGLNLVLGISDLVRFGSIW